MEPKGDEDFCSGVEKYQRVTARCERRLQQLKVDSHEVLNVKFLYSEYESF